MKNFEEKEKQIQEICDRVKNAYFIDSELKIAYYDIIKIVRESYYEGCDDGVQILSEIQAKNQEYITNLLKK
ncbi:MAG: hypothetical protein EOM76_09300 [Sphingobacteriia bacterium]|nr:hypothetical protein [Sphingobacteriia bacterium]